MTHETTVYQIEQVNKFAQKERHLRVFSRLNILKMFFVKVFHSVAVPLSRLKALDFSRFDVLPLVPKRRLLAQVGIFAGVLFIISTISPVSNFSTISMDYAESYIDTYSLPGDVLITDTDGYLLKINPQTGSASRIGMTDYAIHTVEQGETLSTIAAKYGLKTETLMWENNIGNANMVVVGQKLVVPPVDGISYTAKSGDALDSLAKKYNISVDAIIAQNNLTSNTLVTGQHLFLPNAKPIIPAKPTTIAKSSTKSGSKTLYDSNDGPVGAKPFIFPSNGSITQGFRAGHYAVDIASRDKPAVWAAGSGTVVKASSGTWGGGYGNHIIIDHGDGLQTLYAHLDHLTVNEGDYVEQGQAIGQMGNTGRVYGATGIHLHFEVIKNGVKQSPSNYY